MSITSDSELEILKKSVEAILFIAPSPLSINQLASVLEQKTKVIEDVINKIKNEYIESHGLRIQETNGKYQITSAPEYGKIIEKFIGTEESTSLSQAALEAMAIVAFRQPITRPEIDDIRGVNSDGVVRNLLNKGLIQEIGRSDSVGRPILYGTTEDFLHYFGLSSISELPKFESSSSDSSDNNKILKD